MSENKRYTYVRAVREVAVTHQLEDFKSAVDSVSIKTVESPRSTLVRDTTGTTRARKIDPVKVYPVDRLRYTHFERRVPTSPANTRDCYRAAERITADSWRAPGKMHSHGAELRRTPNPLKVLVALAMARLDLNPDDELRLTASSFEQSTPQLPSVDGTEYMLRFDDGPEKDALEEINGEVNEMMRRVMSRYAIGKKIVERYEAPPLGIPFAQLRSTVSETEVKAWEQGVTDNIPEQGLTIRLQQIEWPIEYRNH